MNEAKKYTVELLGNSYTIISDETQDHIAQVADFVRSSIDDIIKHDKDILSQKAVVLATLRIASRLISLENILEQVQSKEQNLIKQVDDHLRMIGEANPPS